MLALLGVYGVFAYGVTQRTREIAIRMALGASRNIMLLPHASICLDRCHCGSGRAGLIVSIGLTRFLSSLLYGVKPLDWVTIAGTVHCAVRLLCIGRLFGLHGAPHPSIRWKPCERSRSWIQQNDLAEVETGRFSELPDRLYRWALLYDRHSTRFSL